MRTTTTTTTETGPCLILSSMKPTTFEKRQWYNRVIRNQLSSEIYAFEFSNHANQVVGATQPSGFHPYVG
jgi:hypothetical protein